jgi:hypothetical protein
VPEHLDAVGCVEYKKGMPDIVHQILSDRILLGTIVLAVFVNLGALGLRWERSRQQAKGLPCVEEAR